MLEIRDYRPDANLTQYGNFYIDPTEQSSLLAITPYLESQDEVDEAVTDQCISRDDALLLPLLLPQVRHFP